MTGKSEHFEVESSDLRFENLLSDAPEEVADELHMKQVVILPSHGTNNAFYVGSLDTLDYLNGNGIKADIYSNDDDYRELGLHSADIWLGTLFVTNIVVPIFCNLIAGYLWDRLKAKEGDNLSVKFIVEKKSGDTVSISFDGKAEEFDKVLEAVKSFSDED
ncbi:hypothetical protein WLQ65_17035 [Pseudoalteromonas piscicida]|uniref:hypothetical protein n=1 Tax=Pseudoalteromonas piscicida TaxID=43662 RepID=UPI0030C8DD68